MDEQKKAEIIQLFDGVAKRTGQHRSRKNVPAKFGDAQASTTIIGSTIVVCSDQAQQLIAALLSSGTGRGR